MDWAGRGGGRTECRRKRSAGEFASWVVNQPPSSGTEPTLVPICWWGQSEVFGQEKRELEIGDCGAFLTFLAFTLIWQARWWEEKCCLVGYFNSGECKAILWTTKVRRLSILGRGRFLSSDWSLKSWWPILVMENWVVRMDRFEMWQPIQKLYSSKMSSQN